MTLVFAEDDDEPRDGRAWSMCDTNCGLSCWGKRFLGGGYWTGGYCNSKGVCICR